MSVLDRIAQPVDLAIFQKAFESFADALSKASALSKTATEADRIAICVGACALTQINDGFLADDNELFRDVSDRLCALDEIICAHRERITTEKRFPGEWVEIAASAKLVGGSFDRSLFTWPTEAEAVQS